jgi:hypothetical protein
MFWVATALQLALSPGLKDRPRAMQIIHKEFREASASKMTLTVENNSNKSSVTLDEFPNIRVLTGGAKERTRETFRRYMLFQSLDRDPAS